jgi:DNA-binding transcriptional regulator YhcF (GntR family)
MGAQPHHCLGKGSGKSRRGMSSSTWKHSRTGHTVRRKKSISPPFIQLPKYMVRSVAWRTLPGTAMAAYIALAVNYKGNNNGTLHLSAREFAASHGCAKDTAMRAIQVLIDRGFIEVVKLSGFNIKDRKRQATEYRLTLYVCDVTNKLVQSFHEMEPRCAT